MISKKRIICLVSILLLVLIVGLAIIYKLPIKENQLIENKLPVLSDNNYSSDNIVSQDDYTVMFKETVPFSNAYPNAEMYNLSLELPNVNMILQGIDDKGKLYYYIANESTDSFGGIYSYDWKTEDWCEIIKTESSSTAAFVAINDDYLLWIEDKKANWQNTSLHVYNLKTNRDHCFYTHTINPQTGLTYVIQFTYPILLDDKVYFEDVINIDENGNYIIKVFCYYIKEEKIEEVAENAKCAMEYKGRPAWLEKSEDNINSVIYSAADEKYIFKNENQLGTYFAAKGDIIVGNDRINESQYKKILGVDSDPNYKPSKKEQLSISSWGIKVINENIVSPIILTDSKRGGFVSNPVTNGNIVAWIGDNAGIPKIYSNEIDKLIDFSEFTTDNVFAYRFIISENYLLLSYTDYDSATSDIINQDYTLFKIK